MRLALAAVALVVAVGPGWAEPLPVVDIDARCAAAFKVYPSAQSRCVQENQNAYDLLKSVWDTLPEAVKSKVFREQGGVSTNGPWFYVTLTQLTNRELTLWSAQHPAPVPTFRP